jgi:hypothetical protein
MSRQLVCLGPAVFLLALVPALDAAAVDLPTRKAGLWEMKVLRSGTSVPDMTMQHCTDATTDKEMSTAFSPSGKDVCSKQDIQKTATGYVSDTVCGVAGMTITSHAEITGDFNSATTIEAKWLGACKPDQKPGDIVMPGGMKMNIMDLEKLKAMVPKQPPK